MIAKSQLNPLDGQLACQIRLLKLFLLKRQQMIFKARAAQNLKISSAK